MLLFTNIYLPTEVCLTSQRMPKNILTVVHKSAILILPKVAMMCLLIAVQSLNVNSYLIVLVDEWFLV